MPDKAFSMLQNDTRKMIHFKRLSIRLRKLYGKYWMVRGRIRKRKICAEAPQNVEKSGGSKKAGDGGLKLYKEALLVV